MTANFSCIDLQTPIMQAETHLLTKDSDLPASILLLTSENQLGFRCPRGVGDVASASPIPSVPQRQDQATGRHVKTIREGRKGGRGSR